MVLWFGGRESIFLFYHKNEFCGKSKVAREPGLACDPLKHRRRVYERGQSSRLETVELRRTAAGASGPPVVPGNWSSKQSRKALRTQYFLYLIL